MKHGSSKRDVEMAFVDNFRRRVAGRQLNTDREHAGDLSCNGGFSICVTQPATFHQDPWVRAQQQLASFDTRRCVMMKHEDWRELSSVMSAISNLYSSPGCSGPPAFAFTLELLLKLGQVLLCCCFLA
jgi:hypothetical protein